MVDQAESRAEKSYLVALTGVGLALYAVYLAMAMALGALGAGWGSQPAVVFMTALYGLMLNDFLSGQSPLSVRVFGASLGAFVLSLVAGRVIWMLIASLL